MQVLTVHSPFRVENLTNQQLEFNVHLFRGPQTLGAPSKGAAAISMVPNRPLSPGQQTYLPVPAIWFVPAEHLYACMMLNTYMLLYTCMLRTCTVLPLQVCQCKCTSALSVAPVGSHSTCCLTRLSRHHARHSFSRQELLRFHSQP